MTHVMSKPVSTATLVSVAERAAKALRDAAQAREKHDPEKAPPCETAPYVTLLGEALAALDVFAAALASRSWGPPHREMIEHWCAISCDTYDTTKLREVASRCEAWAARYSAGRSEPVALAAVDMISDTVANAARSWRWSHWHPSEHVDGARLPLNAHARRIAEGTPPYLARKLVSEIRNALVPIASGDREPEEIDRAVERFLALAVAMEAHVDPTMAEDAKAIGAILDDANSYKVRISAGPWQMYDQSGYRARLWRCEDLPSIHETIAAATDVLSSGGVRFEVYEPGALAVDRPLLADGERPTQKEAEDAADVELAKFLRSKS